MTAFLGRVRGSGTSQTRPEGGVTAPPLGPARPVGQWGFTGVAVTSLGGPLAIWPGYARHVSSSGGLYSFTEAAADRRVALAQAGLWALSYLLYIAYTTAQIVYDTSRTRSPAGW